MSSSADLRPGSTSFRGRWFDGQSPVGRDATVEITPAGLSIRSDTGDALWPWIAVRQTRGAIRGEPVHRGWMSPQRHHNEASNLLDSLGPDLADDVVALVFRLLLRIFEQEDLEFARNFILKCEVYPGNLRELCRIELGRNIGDRSATFRLALRETREAKP